MEWLLVILGIVTVLFILGPRPQLNAAPRQPAVPPVPLDNLDFWLKKREAEIVNLIPEAAAHIVWADGKREQTRYSFLYVHGFSATWRETAPLTERLGSHYGANIVHGRLAGHGEGPDGMLTPAEDWLQSVADAFEIARRVGEQVIIIATSTGAPLTTWLLRNPGVDEQVAACVFLSPNFRIRSPFGSLLTWPWSRYWIHLLLGRERNWDTETVDEASAWTSRYSTLALIEMQKVVDYAKRLHYRSFQTPVAMIYMENDQTIYPPAAIKVFNQWGARQKELIRVGMDGEKPEHVFVGEITAPHRLEWSEETIRGFLGGVGVG